MKTEIVLEKLREPRCIIYTPKVSLEISLLRDYIENFSVYNPNEYISAWDGDYCVKLHEKDIYRVFSYDKKVYAETIKDTLVLKLRLYQFEELVSEKNGIALLEYLIRILLTLNIYYYLQKFCFVDGYFCSNLYRYLACYIHKNISDNKHPQQTT